MVRLGFAGDVMLGRVVDERQRHRAVTAVWGDVLDRLEELDGFAVNLECCLSTRGRAWNRTFRPFHFRADPAWALPALEAAGVDCCAVANNHVLDFEEPALADTLDALDDAGIAHSGAGHTLDDALEPAVFDAGGLDVALVAFTDNTPEYAASAGAPGTAHVEIDVEDEDTRATVEDALSRAGERDPDLLVAALHWGPNDIERPPENHRAFARWLVDEGVDVVFGHSPHCFHGVEVYDGHPILYSTGDFVDDYAVDPDRRNDRSFLFVLRVDADGRPRTLRLHPTEIDDCTVHTAGETAADWSRERMRDRSSELGATFDRDGDALVLGIGE